METTKTHPDFSTALLTSKQVGWLHQNGIATKRGERGVGFYFARGSRWIAPIKATDRAVYLMEVDGSEDGDGEKVVDVFPRLREALVALASTPVRTRQAA